MSAKRAPRTSGAAPPHPQRPLDLFFERLPSRPYCSNNPGLEGLYRLPIKEASECLLIQPNTARLVVCLCFDVDRPLAAMDWHDRHCPEPNITVMNPANGHAHLIYLLEAPVSVSDVARIKPVMFMAAIQEGLRRDLGADRGYSGLIVKNPRHKRWKTHTWRADPYCLEELADHVTLPTAAEIRKRSKQADYAGLGRNCTVFEVVRKQSYTLVREFWRPDGEKHFTTAVLNLVMASNLADIGNPMQPTECRAIARSISKWTWARFNRHEFRAIQSARGQKKGALKRDELLPTAQSMAAEGKSLREISQALGVSFKTIGNWLKASGV
jgi:hypothetical protein